VALDLENYFIDGKIEYTLYVILFFLFLIEIFIYPKIFSFKKSAHELFSNVTIAILHNLGKMIFLPGLVLLYIQIYKVRIFDFSFEFLDFLLALILFDLCYYVHHYSMHHISLLWAAHAVHHQPKYINLSMSIRLSFFNKALTYWFYLPLGYLGIPIAMLAAVGFVNGLYQILTHSRWLILSDPLRKIFIDSRDHHLHHSKDVTEQKMNLGGMFSFWDYLFKTISSSSSRTRADHLFSINSIEYGIDGKEGQSEIINNPFWANLYPFHIYFSKLKKDLLSRP